MNISLFSCHYVSSLNHKRKSEDLHNSGKRQKTLIENEKEKNELISNSNLVFSFESQDNVNKLFSDLRKTQKKIKASEKKIEEASVLQRQMQEIIAVNHIINMQLMVLIFLQSNNNV